MKISKLEKSMLYKEAIFIYNMELKKFFDLKDKTMQKIFEKILTNTIYNSIVYGKTIVPRREMKFNYVTNFMAFIGGVLLTIIVLY